VQSNVRGTFRPTANGIQIKSDWASNNNWLCTLGWNVTDSTGVRFALSAAHCVNYATGTNGGTSAGYWQPCCNFDLGIGVVNINPAWSSSLPGCGTSGLLCTEADVMAIRYHASVSSPKRIAAVAGPPGVNDGGGSISLTGYWTIAGSPQILAVGPNTPPVQKLGRTTGWTQGTLTTTCEARRFYRSQGGVLVDSVGALCVDGVLGARAGTGDSGAPVFISGPTSASKFPIGINVGMGGNTLMFVENSYTICTAGCRMYYVAFAKINEWLGRTLSPN
jgi:hypothetical protein